MKFSVVLTAFIAFCALQVSAKPKANDYVKNIPEDALEEIVPVSRCRALCVKEFLIDTVSTKACQEHEECQKCWEMCHIVQVNPFEAQICSFDTMFGDDCSPGCQEACLYFNYEDNVLFANQPWSSSGLPTLKEVVLNKWLLSWSRPLAPEDKTDALIFALLYKTDHTHPWLFGGDTSDIYATIDGQLATYPYLEFRILAVTSDGIVNQASLVFPSTSGSPSTSTEKPSTTAKPSLTVPITSTTAKDFETSTEPQKSLQMNVILVKDVLEGILTISPSAENVDSLRLSWVRVSCLVSHFLPECLLPSERYAQDVNVQNNKQITASLKDLTYNSAYLIRVTSSGEGTYDETLFFLTPSCHRPDRTFLRCLDDPEADNDLMLARASLTGHSDIKIFLVAFLSSGAVVLIFVIGICFWLRCKRNDVSTFTGTTETSLPIPVITVDGKNFISLEHLQYQRQPIMDYRRNMSMSLPNLLTCDSPRPLRATSTPKDHARIV